MASVVMSLLLTADDNKLVHRTLEGQARQHLLHGAFTTKDFREAVSRDSGQLAVRPQARAPHPPGAGR